MWPFKKTKSIKEPISFSPSSAIDYKIVSLIKEIKIAINLEYNSHISSSVGEEVWYRVEKKEILIDKTIYRLSNIITTKSELDANKVYDFMVEHNAQTNFYEALKEKILR